MKTKKITFFLLLLSFTICLGQIEVNYKEIRNSWDSCFIEIKNKTNKDAIIFMNSRITDYKIYSSNKSVILSEVKSPYANLDSKNFADCMKLSRETLDKIMTRYGIDEIRAIYFLFITNSRIIIPKKGIKIIGFRMFNYNENFVNYPHKKDKYYLDTKIFFKNIDLFLPKKYKDSIEKKYYLIRKLQLPIHEIDIQSFYPNLDLDKIFNQYEMVTDENCNVCLKKKK